MDKVLDIFELYASSDENEVNKFNNKLQSTMDVSIQKNGAVAEPVWLSIMEETVGYLDNIYRNPNRLIINEEEVVKIEKIKKVTVDAVKHLSKNSSLINNISEEGEVQPGRLLNVFKEETFNTYENRFIYTLIQKMLFLIRKEKEKIEKNAVNQFESRKFDYVGQTNTGTNRVDIKIQLNFTSSAQKNGTLESRRLLERLKSLEGEVMNLTLSDTYQQLEKAHIALVIPPIKKTNLILKNVNFQYATKLWDFLTVGMNDVKVSKNTGSSEKNYHEKGKVKKYVDESFLIDYLVLRTLGQSDLKEKDKKEIVEKLIANVVERTIDVDYSLSEEQLKEIVSKQFKIVKYKNVASGREIQDIFKKHISKYVQKITKAEKEG